MHYLDGQGSPYNNAFIMKIGSFMVVEFGVTGNATYVYNAQDLKLDSMRRDVAIHALKARNHVARLIHKKADWEASFDAWLLPRVGWKPETRAAGSSRSVDAYLRPAAAATVSEPQRPPAPPRAVQSIVAVTELIRTYRLDFRDSRLTSGGFWILHDDSDVMLNEKLLRLGFQYRARRGWWKE